MSLINSECGLKEENSNKLSDIMEMTSLLVLRCDVSYYTSSHCKHPKFMSRFPPKHSPRAHCSCCIPHNKVYLSKQISFHLYGQYVDVYVRYFQNIETLHCICEITDQSLKDW